MWQYHDNRSVTGVMGTEVTVNSNMAGCGQTSATQLAQFIIRERQLYEQTNNRL